MDGGILLKNDIVNTHHIENGAITLSNLPGTGVELNNPF